MNAEVKETVHKRKDANREQRKLRRIMETEDDNRMKAREEKLMEYVKTTTKKRKQKAPYTGQYIKLGK